MSSSIFMLVGLKLNDLVLVCFFLLLFWNRL